MKLASLIASKSPVAVQGSKVNLNYSRDHTVDESLDYIVCTLNNNSLLLLLLLFLLLLPYSFILSSGKLEHVDVTNGGLA